MEKKRKTQTSKKSYTNFVLDSASSDFGNALLQNDQILSLLCIKAPTLFAAYRLDIKKQLYLMPELLKNHIKFELESESISEYQIERLIHNVLNAEFIH